MTTLNGGLSLPSGAGISSQLPCIFVNNPTATNLGTSGNFFPILFQSTVSGLSRNQSQFSYNTTTGYFTIPYTGIYRVFLRVNLSDGSTNWPAAVAYTPPSGTESNIYSLPRGSGSIFVDVPCVANGSLRMRVSASLQQNVSISSSGCERQITLIN